MIGPAVRRANERRAQRGLPPLPKRVTAQTALIGAALITGAGAAAA